MSTNKIRLKALEERLRVRGDVFLPSAGPMAGPRALERLMRGCFGDRANTGSNTADPEALTPTGIAQGGVGHENM